MAMVLGKDARNGFDALDCCRVLWLDAGPRLRVAFNAMNDSGQLFGLKTLCNIQLSQTCIHGESIARRKCTSLDNPNA